MEIKRAEKIGMEEMNVSTRLYLFTLLVSTLPSLNWGIEIRKIEDHRNSIVSTDLINKSKDTAVYFRIQIDSYSDSNWKPARYDTQCPCKAMCKKAPSIILPVTSLEVMWDGKDNECNAVKNGRYRMEVIGQVDTACLEFNLWKPATDSGTFVIDKWKYQLKIRAEFTKSESRQGLLWKDNKLIKGKAKDTLLTPFGKMMFMKEGWESGWLKTHNYGRPIFSDSGKENKSCN